MSDTPQNLLIRGVNWLGDAVMTLPAITRLREALPTTRFSLLTHEKLYGLWEHTAHFDHVLTFAKGESPFLIGKRLKSEDFDTSLILPNSLSTALEAWYAGIPRRIGYAGNLRSPLLTHAITARPKAIPMQKRVAIDIEYRLINHLKPQTFPATAHHIHQYLHLAQHLGASTQPLAPQLKRTGDVPSFSATKQPRPYIGLIAGAEYGPAKRWPTEYFIETATQLIEQRQAHMLLLGGPGDRDIASEIADALPADHHTNLAGRTTLPELVSALAACDAVITNDTGPMHVAAAAGTPVIVPFGSTSPDLTGPGLPNDPNSPHQLLRTTADCSPCFLRKCPIDSRCLKEITPTDTVAAVKRVLDQQA